MNAKTAKLLRQYARACNFDPDSVKKEFQKEPKEVQLELIKEMRQYLKDHAKTN